MNDTSYTSLVFMFGEPLQLHDLFFECLEHDDEFILCKHDASKSELPSEYIGIHYHGIVLNPNEANDRSGYLFNLQRWRALRDKINVSLGGYIKSEKVWSSDRMCAYLRLPSKEVVMENIYDGSSVLKKKFHQCPQELIDELYTKRMKKLVANNVDNDDINFLSDLILSYGHFEEQSLISHHITNIRFITVFKKFNFNTTFKKALRLASEKIVCASLADLIQVAKNRIWPN